MANTSISIELLNTLYAGKQIEITGGGLYRKGRCKEVVQTQGKHVDFVLTNNVRSGLIPVIATPEKCVGRVEVLRTFERTVTVASAA